MKIERKMGPQDELQYEQSVSRAHEAVGTLTARETAVWKLIASGLSTKEVAGRLGISFKTARMHRLHLMQKLDIHDVATLTRVALRLGIVEKD
jgi:DNA-binding NarL/FixJ family response regulator